MSSPLMEALLRIVPQMDKRAAVKEGQAAGDATGLAFSKEFAKKVRNQGAKMTATLTPVMLGTLGASIKEASDLGEAVDYSSRVFGENAAAIEQWAQSALGYSETAAMSGANEMAGFLDAVGVQSDQLVGMTTDMLDRVRDIGSAKNMATGDVLQKVMAGLAGETEPLRRLGIDVSATAVAAKAAEMGLVEMAVSAEEVAEREERLAIATDEHSKKVAQYGSDSLQARKSALRLADAEQSLTEAHEGNEQALTQEAKTQAAYAIIMERTEREADNFADTLGVSLPNSLKEAKDALDDAQADLGENLLPATMITTQWTTALIEKFNELPESTQTAVGVLMGVAGVAGPVVTGLGQIGMAMHAVKAANLTLSASFLANPLFWVPLAVIAAVAAIWVFRDEIAAAFRWITDKGTQLGTWLADVWQGIGDKAAAVWQGIKDGFRGAANFMLGVAEDLVNHLLTALQAPAHLANWLAPGDPIPTIDPVSLPRLATGGTAYPDGAVVNIADGGVREHVLRDDQLAEIVGMGGGRDDGALLAELRALRDELVALAAAYQGPRVQVNGARLDERGLAHELDRIEHRARGRRHGAPRPVRR